MSEFKRSFRMSRHRADPVRDVSDEIAFYLDMRVRELMAEGMTEAEARAEAECRFGDRAAITTRVQQLATAQAKRSGLKTLLESARHDVRFALRGLRREPTFALAAIITLALGIGGNAAVFAITDALLRRRPAIHAPDDVVLVYTTCRRGDPRCGSSYQDYVDYRDRSAQLSDLAAVASFPLTVQDEAGADRVAGELVTGNYFSVLGVRAAAGRVFTPNDDAQGRVRAAVLSHRFWRERYGGARNIIGRAILLNGQSYEVAGVAAAGFSGLTLGHGPDVWLPLTNVATLFPTAFPFGEVPPRTFRWMGMLVGRLEPNASVEGTRAEMALISDRLFAEDSAARGPRRTTVDALPRYVVPDDAATSVEQFMLVLQIAVAASLLLACANLANVLLARANARRVELGVRVALGAGERRLARQLLTESLALTLLGSGAGLLLAALMLRAIAEFQLPLGFQLGAINAGITGRVIWFGIGMCIATALVCGAAPAVLAARSRATGLLGSARAGESRGGRATRRALVAVQVALSLVLVIGAALFAQTLRNRLRVDLGFAPRGLTAFSVDPAMNGYDAARADRVLDELLTQLHAVRGVRAATVATRVPLREGGTGTFIEIEGYSPAPGEELRVEFAFVGARYFSTLGLSILRGRDFAAAEQSGQARAVVIDRLTAERWWPGSDPIGGRITLMQQTYQIVGVVDRVAWNGLERGSTPLIFLPLAHDPARGALLTWHVLVRTDRAAVPMGELRDAVRAADPALAPFAFATLEDELATVLAPQRGASTVLASYAVLALLIAAVGIYGVVSYSVTRQRHEFGVRLALGATPAELLKSVLRGMAVPVLAGVLLGAAIALAFGRGVNALLFGIQATDVWTYLIAATLLGCVSLAATLGPALSAARTDPTRVLVPE